jgi:hypothetical protein
VEPLEGKWVADFAQEGRCDHASLRSHLVDALAEAAKCDSLVAIHIETALAILDQRLSIQLNTF